MIIEGSCIDGSHLMMAVGKQAELSLSMFPELLQKSELLGIKLALLMGSGGVAVLWAILDMAEISGCIFYFAVNCTARF